MIADGLKDVRGACCVATNAHKDSEVLDLDVLSRNSAYDQGALDEGELFLEGLDADGEGVVLHGVKPFC